MSSGMVGGGCKGQRLYENASVGVCFLFHPWSAPSAEEGSCFCPHLRGTLLRDPLTHRATFGNWALVEVLTTVQNITRVVWAQGLTPATPDGTAFHEDISQLGSSLFPALTAAPGTY